MQNVAFIINPFSAKKNYQPFIRELRSKVEDPLYLISDSVRGTDDFIKEHFNEVDVFVAVGGDGTISTVAKTIINTTKVLAIFPAGSGNGFSNENNFSGNLDALLQKLKSGQVKEIDTFTVNGKLSINVSGIGFDGAVIEAFEKTSRGFSNYIRTSIRTFLNYKPISVRFEEKFREFDGKYLMINIANTRQFGNNAYIAPLASKSDGLVEIALVKKFPLAHSPIFAYRMFTKKLVPNQYIHYLSVPEIEFAVDSDIWHLDGEFNRIESPVKIKVLPKSLKILI
ncbi:MAG: diacylglycerol kinase [Weeksellaceae bacterium]|nr:diacylglycerol kinase [Weeksellaceae bacterium]